MFFATEYFIDGSNGYWVSYVPFDDVIPFIDWFVIPYVLWYPYLIAIGLLLLLKDKKAYERYVLMIIFGFTACIIFYWIFPNGQDLRPSQFEEKNFFTWIIGMLYSSDTNTNVLPSMHVYGSLVGIIAVIDSDRVNNVWFISFIAFMGIFISASTCFIKQHSIIDAVAAIILCLPLYLAVYWKRIFSKKESMYEKAKNLAAVDADQTIDEVNSSTNI